MTVLAPVPGYRIEGHAIVSADDFIADATGRTPPALNNEADWLRFQTALDAAVVVLLGRLSHESNPNTRRRNRLVVSSRVDGVERRDDAWWWNPGRASLGEALATAAPEGGTVAIPGGHLVFDMFRGAFDAFHLARAPAVVLGAGIPLFSAITAGITAGDVLIADGMTVGTTELLDPATGVNISVWRRSLVPA